MTKASPFRIVLLLAAIGVAAFLYLKLRPPKDDREFLLSLPSQVAQWAEKKQPAAIRKLISKDYSDSQGHTYQDLNGLVVAHTMAPGELSVYTLSPEVDLDMEAKPPRATLKFKAAMMRGPRAPGALDVLPETATLYDFELTLGKSEDEGWQLYSGTWKRSN